MTASLDPTTAGPSGADPSGVDVPRGGRRSPALPVTPVAVRLDGRVPEGLTVAEAVRRLAHRARVAAVSGAWACGALVACDPLRVAPADGDPFATLAEQPVLAPATDRVEWGVSSDRPATAGPDAWTPVPGAARVGGGWFGYLSFPATRPAAFPRWSLAWYPDVLRFDGTWWWYEALLGSAPGTALDRRTAQERLDALCADLARPPALPRAALEVTAWPERLPHVVAVEECVRAIRRGEIFQANIAGRVEGLLHGSAHDAWARLVETHDPARAALVADPAGTAVSASPELFLRRAGREVRTAPIKGTRPRGDGPGAEAERARLAASAKDAAENVMIVDLMRNDLSRVCAPGSVRVPRLLGVEPHAGVWHLVSEVRGVLAEGRDDADLLRACFPPGSVTGAPKIRAVELIEQLEAVPRGLFTGAIGWASPVAGLELSVAIRTLEVAPGGRATLAVGGGITVDSTPVEEWAECLTKAAPVVGTLQRPAGPDGAGSDGARRASAGEPSPPTAGPGEPAALFETLLAVDGRPRRLADHVGRLRRSFTELTGSPLTADVAGAVAAAARGRPGTVRVRVDVPLHPGSAVAVTVSPWTVVDLPAQPGVVLRARAVDGGVPHKLADRAALDAHEAAVGPGETPLLVAASPAGPVVLETTRSSVFVVVGARLRTPPLDGRILPGTARLAVLDLEPAAAPGVVTLAELAAADGVFLTNALRGVQWVREVRGPAGETLATWPAPLPAVRRLATRLAADDRSLTRV